MTDIADPEDVVLYDLDHEATTDDLIALTRDPERRWFARARLAAIGARGALISAAWNPKLHPRGKDGKFIQVWGLVRWIGDAGRWRRGQVMEIDAEGDIRVREIGPSGFLSGSENDVTFKNYEAPKLTGMPHPKAKLDLPDPSSSQPQDLKWQKIGGQGGSNPGGKYKADSLYGTPGDIDNKAILSIAETNGLTTGLPGDFTAIGRTQSGAGLPGKALFRRDDGVIVDVYGQAYNPPPDSVTWFSSIDSASVDKAWAETKAAATAVSANDEWYVKKAKSPDHGKIEVLANRLYEAAGVNVPSTQQGINPGFLASQIQTDVVSQKEDLGDRLNDPEILSKVREDFVVDAWLANWDVVGLNYENIQIIDDVPYRIDAGGALTYRAQGGPKGAMFGPQVGEIESLTNPSINPQATNVFKDVTDAEILGGVKRVAALSPEGIKAIVEEMEVDESVADTLIARRQYLIDNYGVADPWEVEPPTPVEIPDPPAPDVVAGPGGFKQWDHANQQWTLNPALHVSEPYNSLAAFYDSDHFEVIDGKTLWESPPPGKLILHEGRLYTAHPEVPHQQATLVDILTDEKQTGVFINPHATVYAAANSASTSDIYTNLMNQLWGAAVAGDSARTIDDLFATVGTIKKTPTPGSPEMPEFRSENLWATDPVQVGQYVYDSPHGKLYRATIGRYGTEGDLNIAVTDPFTGSQTVIGYGGLYTPVNDDSGYSTEVLNAIVKDKETADLEALIAEEEAIEQSVKNAQDAKALAAPVATDGVAEATEEAEWVESAPSPFVIPPETALPYNTAWSAVQTGALKAGLSKFGVGGPGTPGGYASWFDDSFGDYGEGKTISKAKVDAFADIHGIEKAHIDTHLVQAGVVIGSSPEPNVEAPDPPAMQDVNTPASPIDNVHPALASKVHPFFFDPATNEELVGKVILVKNKDSKISTDDDDAVTFQMWGSPATGKTVNTLVYVTGIDPNNGSVEGVSGGVKFKMGSGAAEYLDLYVVDGLTDVDMKLSPKPTMKANGDIVHAGVVIGVWEKKYKYWGSDIWTFTIFGEHSTYGKTVTGSVDKKSKMAVFVQQLSLLKPVPVKTKKSSAGSKKVKEYVAKIPTLEGATFSGGTTAKLGDWVQSTKGGGGFVGKIVGWPNQEAAPGLVFAVDNDGVQKAVKLKTQKKVPGPEGAPSLGTPFIDNVPSAYTDLKLSDGNVPVVGMKVSAGKPGGAKTEGIITNINPSQGWVYILTDEGKTVSKTFSVTKVTGAPELYWDLPAPAATAVANSLSPAKAAPGQVLYPAESGETIFQDSSVQDAWLAGNPGRKLSKDGYAPVAGMQIRTSKGEHAVIYQLPGEWASSAVNSVKIYNLDTQKLSSTTWSTASVNHEAELVGMEGKPLLSIGGVATKVDGFESEVAVYPAGTPIYRKKVSINKYIDGKYRTFTDWVYFGVTGDDSVDIYMIPNWSKVPQVNKTSFTWGLVKGTTPPSEIEKVGISDPTSPAVLKITPYWGNHQEFTHSNIQVVDELGVPVVTIIEPTPVPAPPKPEPVSISIPASELKIPAGHVSEPEPEPADTSVDEQAVPVVETGVVEPPAVVPGSSIQNLVPPPSQAKIKKSTDPIPPQVTAPEPVDLSLQNALIGGAGAKTLQSAAEEMIALKDSSDPGTGSRYAIGDSDVVEDMAFRYSIEKTEDEERLVLRFRLREDLSEESVAKMVTSGDAQTGAWKTHSSVFPHQLEPGDAIAIRIASGSKLIKPTEGNPNARVLGEPVLLGKTDESGFDVYRVKVQTSDGQIGETDLQHRPSSSILTYEWDPEAIPENTGKKLTLTPTAAEVGWVRRGAMTMPGSNGSILIDATGKANFQGMTQSGMAKGSGGHWLHRQLTGGGQITLNAAHTAESGTGFDTTRRANLAGEVRISVPISHGKPTGAYMTTISRAMELVGITPEKQAPPSDEHVLRFALQKLVTNYHPEYKYRDKLVSGPDDPKVIETLDHMSKKLQKHLGRDVTLDDLRIHTHKSGRIQIVMSPDVAIAMGKLQGNHHYQHAGASHLGFEVLGSPVGGVMGADERWSLGVMNQSMSGFTDQTIGSGDRIYMRGNSSKSVPGGMVVMNPLMINSGTEVYTNKNNDSDSYGRRGSTNKFMETGPGPEVMYKRIIEPEMISYYIAESGNREAILAKLKSKGITHIGGRPVEEIVVTTSMFKDLGDISTVGIDFWKDDIPVTQIIAALGAPAAAPVAAGGAS